MSGAQSKEQRRNLRRTIGEAAATSMGETRSLVNTVHLAQQTLARELVDLRAATGAAVDTLNARVDGASAWGEKNEDEITKLYQRLGDVQPLWLQAQVLVLRRRLLMFETMTLFERLKWALFGIVPFDIPDPKGGA